MLHDAIIGRPRSVHDRRTAARHRARHEVVVLWHHDMETAIRYPVVDRGANGLRIITATPLCAGMTGVAANLLPAGERLDRPCTVCWSRSRGENRGYEAGLRLM